MRFVQRVFRQIDKEKEATMKPLAWGAKVSPEFRQKVRAMAFNLNTDPDYAMSIMAWESGETFRSDIKNFAGSGAVGLIQFMPQTCAALGTTTEAMASMRPEDQLDFCYKYWRPWSGRLKTLSDFYMSVLWPNAIGKPEEFALFIRGDSNPKRYLQNSGLDFNKDGVITKAEASNGPILKLAKGMRPEYIEPEFGLL